MIIRRRGAYASSSPPTIGLSLPLEAFTVTVGDYLTASGTCEYATRVDTYYRVDGGSWTLMGTDAVNPVLHGTWSVSHLTLTADAGAVDVYAVATGRGGTADSSVVSGSVYLAPTVSITSPSGGFETAKEAILTVSGPCTNATGVALYARVAGGAWTLVDTDSSVGGGSWSVDYGVTDEDATLELRATATGDGGSVDSSIVSGTILALPSVTISAPTTSYQYSEGQTIAASGTCGGATRVDLYLKIGTGAWTLIGSDTTIVGGTWAVDYVVQASDDGATTYLKATATGDGGSADSSTLSGSLYAIPSVAISTPFAGFATSPGEGWNVTGTCSTFTDDVELYRRIDGGSWDYVDDDTTVSGGTWSNYQTTPNSPGVTIEFKATANHGIVSTDSAVRSGWIQTPGTISITSPIGGETYHVDVTYTVQLDANDPDGIDHIEVYWNDVLQGNAELVDSAWRYNWTPGSEDIATDGSLQAAMVDSYGYVVFSDTVILTVTPA